MKRKIIILMATVWFMPSLFAQNENLPVVKATSVLATIKADTALIPWYLSPENKLDVFETTLKEVTYYTDIDSFTVIMPRSGKYDFNILLNEKDVARQQVKYKYAGRKNGKITNSFDIFSTVATRKPANFDPHAVNLSFRHSLSGLIHFGLSDFALGIGLGISFQNYHIDAFPSEVLPVSMQTQPATHFIKIASFNNPAITSKKNKMTLTYLDIPFELSYCNKKGIIVSAGPKVDYLIRSHYQYKGSDYLYGTNKDINIKKFNLDNLSNFQFGPIVRVGYKYLQLYATYSFIPVYKSGEDNRLNPFGIGISLAPFY